MSNFDRILSRLVMHFRAGELVPFLGAGASAGICRGWKDFVSRLEQKAEISCSIKMENVTNAEELIRHADTVSRVLRMRGVEAALVAFRSALRLDRDEFSANANSPIYASNTAHLARIAWPLVLTTNYDSVFADAYAIRHTLDGDGAVLRNWPFVESHPNAGWPTICGRSEEDCKTVLLSLDVSTGPILFALHGFIEKSHVGATSLRDEHYQQLASQIVLGHHDYVRIVRQSSHFRHLFSTLFRRRSFLFVGTSLTDPHLCDLLEDAIWLGGAASRPHFAFLPKAIVDSTGDFLARNLNITAIPLNNDFIDLPEKLDALREACKAPKLWSAQGGQEEIRYSLAFGQNLPFTQASQSKSSRCSLGLHFGPLPYYVDDTEQAFVLSVGRGQTGLPIEGNLVESFRSRSPNLPDAAGWVCVNDYLYRLGVGNVYGVVARRVNDGQGNVDSRELGAVAIGFKDAICEIVERKVPICKIHCALIAAGPGHFWHPIQSLVAMIRGVRAAQEVLAKKFKGEADFPDIEIWIVDKIVWSAVIGQRVPVQESLVTDELRVYIRVTRPSLNETLLSKTLLLVETSKTLLDVASKFSIPVCECTGVRLNPKTIQGKAMTLRADGNATLEELGIMPGTIIEFVLS